MSRIAGRDIQSSDASRDGSEFSRQSQVLELNRVLQFHSRTARESGSTLMLISLPPTRLPWIGLIRRVFLTLTILGSCFSVDASAEYLLSPGDVLEFSAVGLRELQQTTTINVDGQASFPLLGEIRAAGMSISELQRKIRELLPTRVFRLRTVDG